MLDYGLKLSDQLNKISNVLPKKKKKKASNVKALQYSRLTGERVDGVGVNKIVATVSKDKQGNWTVGLTEICLLL